VSPTPAGLPPSYVNRASVSTSQRRSFTTTTGSNIPLGGGGDRGDRGDREDRRGRSGGAGGRGDRGRDAHGNGRRDDSGGWMLTDSGEHDAIWPSTLNTGGHQAISIPSVHGTPGFQSPPTAGSSDQYPREPHSHSGHQASSRGRNLRTGPWRGGDR
jgi:hypothetical protein